MVTFRKWRWKLDGIKSYEKGNQVNNQHIYIGHFPHGRKREKHKTMKAQAKESRNGVEMFTTLHLDFISSSLASAIVCGLEFVNELE